MTEQLAPEIVACIERALEEDIGSGDVTTDIIVPQRAIASGRIIAKQIGIVAGLDVAQVYSLFDPQVDFTPRAAEGAQVGPGQLLAVVTGPARACSPPSGRRSTSWGACPASPR